LCWLGIPVLQTVRVHYVVTLYITIFPILLLWYFGKSSSCSYRVLCWVLFPASVLVCLFVWRLPFDLSSKRGPASSYTTAGITLRVTDVLKPSCHDKVEHQRERIEKMEFKFLTGMSGHILLNWKSATVGIVLEMLYVVRKMAERTKNWRHLPRMNTLSEQLGGLYMTQAAGTWRRGLLWGVWWRWGCGGWWQTGTDLRASRDGYGGNNTGKVRIM
jgi:hypothetical protein